MSRRNLKDRIDSILGYLERNVRQTTHLDEDLTQLYLQFTSKYFLDGIM